MKTPKVTRLQGSIFMVEYPWFRLGEKMPKWGVLLVGGTSGVGKSTVSRILASRFDASLGQVDDFRMAIQSTTTSTQQPDLHFFIKAPGVAREGIWQNRPELLCEALIKVGEVVSQALEVVVAHHVATSRPIVLEGDGILPSLAYPRLPDAQEASKHIRSVFLEESDEEFFFREFGGPSAQPYSEAWNRTRMHWLYGKWLIEKARLMNLPVVSSRPWATLAERIAAAGSLQGPLD